MNEKSKHLHKLADIIASVILISLVLFIGLSVTSMFGSSLTEIGPTWFGLYALITVMSATKLYGKSVYEAVKGAGSGFLQLSSGKK